MCLGLGFGASPIFRQQNRLWFSIWTLRSSVRNTSQWRIQDFSEGCLRSGPIQKVGGRFRSDIRKVGGGGGGGALQVRYTKSGGGGGGGPFRFRSDTFGHTENIYMYLPKVGTCRYFLVETTYVTQAENFTYIGCIA